MLAPLGNLNVSNQTANHTESLYMPDLIYYQVMRPNNTDCMHYAWSVRTFPTLFVSQTEGQCAPQNHCNISYNLEDFSQDQSYGSVDIPGKEGDFAMALILHRLIEFKVTDKSEASDLFDPTQACNASNPNYNSTYLDDTELEWSSNIDDKTLMAQSTMDNSTFHFTIRVSACVYCVSEWCLNVCCVICISCSITFHPLPMTPACHTSLVPSTPRTRPHLTWQYWTTLTSYQLPSLPHPGSPWSYCWFMDQIPSTGVVQ